MITNWCSYTAIKTVIADGVKTYGTLLAELFDGYVLYTRYQDIVRVGGMFYLRSYYSSTTYSFISLSNSNNNISVRALSYYSPTATVVMNYFNIANTGTVTFVHDENTIPSNGLSIGIFRQTL